MTLRAAPGAGLGWMEDLLSPGASAELLAGAGLRGVAARPEYIRLKGRDGALVGYRITGIGHDGSPVSRPGDRRSVPRGRAREVAEKWDRLRPVPTPLGPGVRPVPAASAVLFLFPNDARLRGLRFVTATDKLKRMLGRLPALRPDDRVRGFGAVLTPMRYKPERRFIASARVRIKNDRTGDGHRAAMFLRFFPDGRGDGIHALSTAIHRRGGRGVVPRPLGTVLGGRLFVEEEADGPEMLEAVLDGSGDPAALAGTLLRLHEIGPLDVPLRSPEEALRALEEGFGWACSIEPALRPLVDRVLLTLRRRVPRLDDPVLVHGDLHLHQVLLPGPAGGEPMLVDLERAGLGHRLEDLGEVAAHLVELAGEHEASRNHVDRFRESLIETYLRASPAPADETLRFFTARGLAGRALLRFRRVEPRWEERATALLESALRVLRERGEGSSGRGRSGPRFFRRGEPGSDGMRWEVVYPHRDPSWPGFGEAPDGSKVYGIYERDRDAFRPLSPAADPVLPALAGWLDRGELVSYRVGRRGVVRVRGHGHPDAAFAKVLPSRKAARVLERARVASDAAERSGSAFRVPRPVLARPEEGFIVFEPAPGRPLHDAVMENGDGVGRALTRTAAAVAALHRSGIGAALPAGRPPITSGEYLAMAVEHFPERRSAYEEALERGSVVAAPAGGSPPCLIHGDLHDRNILLGADRVALIDLDRLCLGRAEEDVGNLAAHLLLRVLQRGDGLPAGRALARRWIGAYDAVAPAASREAMMAAGARTLFRLSCLYLFRRRWQGVTPLILDEALRWAVPGRSAP